jgi:hypothetical protein
MVTWKVKVDSTGPPVRFRRYGSQIWKTHFFKSSLFLARNKMAIGFDCKKADLLLMPKDNFDLM